MWYRMPTGDDARREASASDAHRALVAIRCAGTLLARRGTGALDKALGGVIVELIEGLSGRSLRVPAATPTPAGRRSSRTETPSP